MITSLYLSNNNIQAVTGTRKGDKLLVQQMYEVMIPEGSLINGVITNEEELKELLQEFWEENQLPKKNVSLVVNSYQFLTKTMQLPSMPSKRLREVVFNEFNDVKRVQDSLYDYIDVTKEKRSPVRDLIGIVVERNFVESYLNLFASMDIKLSSITSSYIAETQILSHIEKLQGETNIIMLLDGDNMTTILWEDDQCVYHNRVRLFSDHGTNEFGVEVAQSANRLVQFHQTRQREKLEELEEKKKQEEADVSEENNVQKPEKKKTDLKKFGKNKQDDLEISKEADASEELHAAAISSVCLGGIQQEDHEFCFQALQAIGLDAEYLENGENIEVPPESEDEYFSDFVTVIGNLYPTLNLLNQYNKYKQGNDKLKELLRRFLPAIAVFVLCLIVSLAVWIPNFFRQRNLNNLNKYLQDPDNLASQSYSDHLSSENDRLQKMVAEAEFAGDAVDSYPVLTSEVKEEIDKCTDGKVTIEISSFYSDNGALTMKTTADKVEDINAFIERLRRSDLFWKVEYTGYSGSAQDKSYNINVTCYLESQWEKETETQSN